MNRQLREAGQQGWRARLRGCRLARLFGAAFALCLWTGLLSPAGAVPSGCGAPACVNIGGLTGDTFDLGTWNGASNTNRLALRHCVFSNRPNVGTKTYNATPIGVGTPANAFVLAGPGGNLPYQVEINDGSGYVVVSAGGTTNFDALSEAEFDTCTDSGTSAGGQQMRITVFRSDMETFEAGTYTGTLRMDVATTVGGATDFEITGPITIEIPPLVRLLNLKNNFAFGTWNPDGAVDLVNSDAAVCVWSNHASDEYTVTATTTTGAFEVTQAGEELAFEVWWSDVPGVTTVAGSDAELDYNTPATFTTTATTTTCAGGDTASIVLAMTEAALSDALAGAYSGSMTITIGVAP